ncbi:LysR family transcriptional regulator [Lacisediminimonas sp.]|uniref:LysR family transcriptional regulator n=1 Tax=Lacisediminimonas sp. TaxID=3060582 RepID=UPI00271E1757|nr:LysR family transcriptional regulator [Lacisediminimonas sp.]MDO8298116.1 LysR family transcriptional regulator [Lacisediminimonas sp.]
MDSRLLENLAVFVDTVRAGAFSTVARQRGLAASSISRQIDALEADLQVALFTRSTRSLKPTKAGELLYHRAVRILEDLANARSEVTSLEHEVQGSLQISCLPTFGRRYVLPCLNQLFDKYPALKVELDLSENMTAPTIERQDVAVRFGEQPDSSLFATRIGTQRYVICAAPGYLRRYGTPLNKDDLHGHRLVDKRHRSSMLGWREILGTHRLATTSYILESDDFELQRMAALAGSGIVRLPDWVVGQDIRNGHLQELEIAGVKKDPDAGIYLLRALPKPNAKLKAFTQELLEVVGTPNSWQC